MLILYINYIDMDAVTSGSKVRPVKMYQAFLDEGHEVKLLTGAQSIAARKKRRAAVAEVRRWLDTNRPDICYIESPYYPILWSFDRRLIRRIHRMGVPIGYFYRDFPHKLPEEPAGKTGFAEKLKNMVFSLLRRVTDRLLRCADIVYLPSEPASELFSYRDMRPLPPAGENRLEGNRPEERTCIYVGGINGTYDGAQMLDAFHILNAGGDTYRLILVCRKADWESFAHPDAAAPWLEVHHVSGEELVPLYRRAALALCLNTPNPYDHYTVSVKLYEYMSYGLPVVVNGAPEMERLTRENGTGLAVAYGAENAAAAVREFFTDETLRKTLCGQTARTLLSNNLWIHRVRQVTHELTERNPSL